MLCAYRRSAKFQLSSLIVTGSEDFRATHRHHRRRFLGVVESFITTENRRSHLAVDPQSRSTSPANLPR
jgi:hypothetical protein